jgi:hypothetical protein
MRALSSDTKSSDTSLIVVLSAYRGALIGLALFSGLINVLYLTGSFYMLQVYDGLSQAGAFPPSLHSPYWPGPSMLGRPPSTSSGAAFCCTWRAPLMNS